ncbi:MAG TPA: hypothetical protein VJY33_22205 [Isosphaeraceae bacterium]|nr:hypothetical protein [Isosphaeraceae bacterium]
MKRPRIPTRDYEAVLRAAWARGWHYHPEQEPRTMPAPNPDPAILGMLSELETVLAEAEELRYRILCAVRNNATPPASPQKQPVATHPKPAPAPAPKPKPVPHLDTSALVRGLWAWAKQHEYADQLIALGKAAAFPARIIDWSREQVEEAIEALAILVKQPSPARSTAPAPAHVGPQADPRPPRSPADVAG